MAINLTTKFLPYVDEQFSTSSKKSLITNNDFDWTGAHTVKVYKISTSEMNDYNRNPSAGQSGSRFGAVKDLDATTEEFTLKKDRSFTFAIDKLDADETEQTLAAASALERQNREVVIPEVDSYTYKVMCENAGTKPEAAVLSEATVYERILKANSVLDDFEVPETDRQLIVTPEVYTAMKKSSEIVFETDIGADMRAKGVIAMLDGCNVIKVPASRLPENFGFMVAHPSATVAPVKLEDYRIHQDPPGISGSLVEGRICYDAFVLDNKKNAIYYQTLKKENSIDDQGA